MLDTENNCECSEKKYIPDVSMYSYKFSKISAEEDTCEEKKDTRCEMLSKVRSLSFSIVELAEYLDTHPNDKDVLYKEEAKQYFDNNVIIPKDLDVIKIN